MPITTIPRILREKLGEDGAEALVELMNQAGSGTRDEVLTFVEEKFERRLGAEVAKVNERITTEIGKVNERITTEIGKLDQRITTEIGKVNERISGLEAHMDVRIADTQTALIRWMFIFWVGQLGAILGILFVFFGS